MNEETYCITNKEKTTKNEWKHDESNFLVALYSVYKKQANSFSILFSLTCLNKDTSVLLQVINIWTN